MVCGASGSQSSFKDRGMKKGASGGPVLHLQFGQDVADVVAHRVVGHHQAFPYLAVAQAECDVPQYLQLTIGQRNVVIVSFMTSTHNSLNATQHTGVEWLIARGGSCDDINKLLPSRAFEYEIGGS